MYSYVERKQIPHFRMMGRSIRFSLSELEKWRRTISLSMEESMSRPRKTSGTVYARKDSTFWWISYRDREGEWCKSPPALQIGRKRSVS